GDWGTPLLPPTAIIDYGSGVGAVLALGPLAVRIPGGLRGRKFVHQAEYHSCRRAGGKGSGPLKMRTVGNGLAVVVAYIQVERTPQLGIDLHVGVQAEIVPLEVDVVNETRLIEVTERTEKLKPLGAPHNAQYM